VFCRKSGSVVAFIALTVLVGSSVVVVPNGGAADAHGFASSSAFCTTIKTFAIAEPPTYVTVSTYHVWAELYLGSYEKLASEAPTTSVKELLNEVVAIMKYEVKATSLTKLKRYVASKASLWKEVATQLFKSGVSCATTT